MDVRTVKNLLGHTDVSTAMIYVHIVKRPGAGGRSPFDMPNLYPSKPCYFLAQVRVKDKIAP